MPTCNKCEAQIRWIKTRKGKSVPLDPEVVEIEDVKDGVWIANDDGLVWKIEDGKEKPKASGPWYYSHFSTCKG